MLPRTTLWCVLSLIGVFWFVVLVWNWIALPETESCASRLEFCQTGLQACLRKITPSDPFDENSRPRDTIYVVTPTYARLVQKAELTRLSHTFLHVKNLHWIVVEDANRKSDLVASLLKKSRISYTHLNADTPQEMRVNKSRGDRPWSKPRGVLQRNEGLRWVRSQKPRDGVVYFADDDNTYDLDLFAEISTIKKVGVWPVAFVGEIAVEKPVVKKEKVVSWDVAYKPHRTFAMDMAGFAVHVRVLTEKPGVTFDFGQPVGHQETFFLESLGVKLDDLEPKADSCRRVLVWHTRTQSVNLVQERKWNMEGRFSQDGIEI